jgi:hypothetical protein
MDNYWKSEQIRIQLEAVILETILSVLDRIAQQIYEAKKGKEDKF